jgi:hypothetical protein
MTFTNRKHLLPKSLKLSPATSKASLLVHGQGVVIFDASGACSLTFSDASGTNGLRADFTETSILVHLLPSNEPLIDKENTRGIAKQNGAYYWLSLDSQNCRIYAGIGEARKETAIYTFQFSSKSEKKFLESLRYVTANQASLRSLLRDPITRNLPLIVKDTDEHTMDSIAAGIHMPKVNLSLTAQKLHDCISGKRFKLNTADFPNFTKAIEHSISTPGKWCYERLKQKATEFDKDKPDLSETYLRITLNENNGESPGIPYVMEIWPVGHYSPIHNHGGSSAIIRVLHGSIHVRLFPFLSGDELEPFAEVDFHKDDITWISPSLNQVHQLKNLPTNTKTCITIQCYMYESDDTEHYDYFDYLDGSGVKQVFEPDSDMDYLEFKATMKKEWAEQSGFFQKLGIKL